ncbi:NLI interacting factor-like phosphatase family protein [Ascosphaera apis ARSEF 7405]|uniref:RNA polymerase II subunit A C-terminal domain phosphatase n=1 Tax=Ascosphaera apis ARSEF 7405 TaxID=392613 RepID=A0A168AZR3_9EURO|nr:NLI interacting factor-like phosphatase family protein [Ascosphaera apis ARSEF 7405]
MLFTLPRQLHYPITITKFLVKEGDDIELGTQLFTYTYTTTVSQVDRFRERKDVQMTYPTTYESPIEGKFMGWKIEEKTYVERPIIVAEVEELCAHDVIFGGMCAICGKDMTRVESYLEPTPQQARVRIRNEDSEVTVSQAELNRNEEAAKLRLLKDKKLSLVVDLDQTIIHATVDPTVAEWQNDPTNPNYDAVKDVRAFQLAEDIPTRQDGKRGSAKARANKDAKDASTSSTASNGCWYYIKLRPGLMEFLEKVSQIYELHIYTMGTKAYAQEVAKLVDPDKKIFGNRILSRDDSGSLTVKNLQRLFPVDQKMVVIIDDRGDVWKWSENLIKVAPYDFFVGIGDINSSFLPEKPALKQEEQQDEEKEAKQDEESLAEQEKGRTSSTDEGQDDVSTLQQLVKMGGGDNPGLLQEQTEKRDETIQHQVEDRPLLRQQKALDEDSAPSTPEGDAAGEHTIN